MKEQSSKRRRREKSVMKSVQGGERKEMSVKMNKRMMLFRVNGCVTFELLSVM